MMKTTAFLLAALILLVGARAAADPVADAREHFEAGNGYFTAGRFADALREFEQGYAIVPNPKFLLNMGQTYRKLGRLDEARGALLKYMDTLSPGDVRRADVARVVAEIDLELGRAATVEPGSPKSPPVAEQRAPQAQPQLPPPPPPPPPPMTPARRHARLAGIALLAGGAALVIVGGALVGVAVKDNRLLADPPSGWVFDPSVVRERDAFYPAGLSLIAVGGAGIAGGLGALLYAVRSPSQLAFAF